MKSNIEDLPIAAEDLGEMIRGEEWGGMTSAYMQYPAGLDLAPLLKGLERDHCQWKRSRWSSSAPTTRCQRYSPTSLATCRREPDKGLRSRLSDGRTVLVGSSE
jgi:hypothetical protein